MNIRITQIIGIALTSLLFLFPNSRLVAQGDYNQHLVTKTYDYAGIRAVHISEDIKVLLLSDALDKGVTVTGPAAAVEQLYISFERGTLDLRFATDNNLPGRLKQQLRITVHTPTIHTILARYGAEVEGRGTLKCDKLSLTVDNGAEISDLRVEGRSISITANRGGEADVDFLGQQTHASISASKGSKVDLYIPHGKQVKVSSASGSEVDLSGNSKQCVINASSSSEIDADNLFSSLLSVNAGSSSEVEINGKDSKIRYTLKENSILKIKGVAKAKKGTVDGTSRIIHDRD